MRLSLVDFNYSQSCKKAKMYQKKDKNMCLKNKKKGIKSVKLDKHRE